MKTLLVVQGKGGGPKTATVRNLAVAATLAGHRVATLDTDPQGTLTHWHSFRPAEVAPIASKMVPLLSIDGRPEAIDGEDLLIVDTPTAIEFFPTSTQILFDAADLVVVPVQPGPEDLLSLQDMMPYLRERRRPMVFLLSQVKARTKAAQQARDLLQQLGTGALAPVEIPSLAEVPNSFLAGLGTAEVPGTRTGPLFRELWSYLAPRLELAR